MGLLDRFKKRPQGVLPEEVQQYYQSEQRQRASVAILLGLGALIVTVLVAAGLFFGGRYAYRQIVGDDKPTPATEQQQTPDNQPGATEEPTGNEPENNDQQPESQPAPSDNAPSPGSTPPAQSPTLGDEADLPRTGDEGM